MAKGDTATPGEFDLIRRYFGPLAAQSAESLGLSDDAALIKPPAGMEMAVTTDMLVAGIHFRDDDPPETVAAKLLAVNLSDLAAMGADPHAYTLAAAWPRGMDTEWIADFADGLGRAQAASGTVLIGGDTVATSGPLTLSLTAFGYVETGKALHRAGAAAGERIYVTGNIGDGAAGLRVLNGELVMDSDESGSAYVIGRYRAPTARTDVGRQLAGLASAAIDISDGLLADLRHIAETSRVDMEINVPAVPLSAAVTGIVTADRSALGFVLGGGDDYELAFTAPADHAARLAQVAETTGVPITEIGTVTGGEGQIRCRDDAGKEFVPETAGYRHF